MSPLLFMAITFVSSVLAGLVGSLLGLGGGIIVVPALTLLLGVDIRFAIGASIISVIATSSGAGAAYVKEHLANVRVGMFLELSTTLAAMAGALITGMLAPEWLYMLFAGLMVFTAVAMFRHNDAVPRPLMPDPLADRLRMHSSYHDHAAGKQVSYRVCRSKMGFALSAIAGIVSGLLGVGGGILKVPIMSMGMHMPLKAATATSNFMMGVTAAASAGVYFARGQIAPQVAGPVALGVLAGATLGSKLLKKIENRKLRLGFTLVLGLVAVQMFLKGIK